MKSLHLLYALVLVAASAFFGAVPAHAIVGTWVSTLGDDANDCSSRTPCRTFAGAITKTAIGGQIHCVDSGTFGSVFVAKSVTFDCTGTSGGIFHTSLTPIVIDDRSTAKPGTIKVVIRGMSINGTLQAAAGIQFLSGSALTLDRVNIQNEVGLNTEIGIGLNIEPSAGTAEIFIIDCRIAGNGRPGVGGGGIVINPTDRGSANVFIDGSHLTDNDTGLTADITSTTGFVSVGIMNSLVAGNRIGLAAIGDADGSVKVNVTHSSIVGSIVGVTAISPAVVRIGDSMLMSNVTTLRGNVFSYGNNQIVDNGSNGASSPIAPLSQP